MEFIRNLADVTLLDVSLVGGKNAALGHMIRTLAKTVRVPNGFATTTQAYRYFIAYNKLEKQVRALAHTIRADTNARTCQRTSVRMRALIEAHPLPPELEQAIIHAYEQFNKNEKMHACAVAVRSSATAEDLPGASFAGQQETFLNVRGQKKLLIACKRCFSSLFTARALMYRALHNIPHDSVAISVGIQRMVRADIGSAGVAFTLDPETGFKNVVCINGTWGLGEPLVQGTVDPDTWYVDKGRLEAGYQAIIKRTVGTKRIQMVLDRHGNPHTKNTPVTQRTRACLSDEQVCQLARLCLAIEAQLGHMSDTPHAMDIEWARDGHDGSLWIVQARPETVHAIQHAPVYRSYHLTGTPPTPLCTGQAVGHAIVHGRARIMKHYRPGARLERGDILVAPMTNPDWLALMKQASGIITDHGSRTCHAAIVSRELGIPACVCTGTATRVITEGQTVTIDCSSGQNAYVYNGALDHTIDEIALSSRTLKNVYLNLSNADQAFALAALPVGGIGLMRIEFVIAHRLGMHPLVYTDTSIPTNLAKQAKRQAQCAGYKSPRDFFVHTLAHEMATIASAFWPQPILVRFSDFKTAEYRQLAGGSLFEPCEPNPMLGLRGASRYASSVYRPAFELECQALAHARNHLGFTNIRAKIPFVRSVKEAQVVITIMKHNKLARNIGGLEIIMTVETPANSLELEKFCPLFDGFSIGSNDLTQFTLAIDRDNPVVTQVGDERRPAVKRLIAHAIKTAHAHKRHIGICGQAPSDFPEFARWLARQNIDYVSLNADSIIKQLAQKPHFRRQRQQGD